MIFSQKYSYGQLTRDFRDTAACAVFVVKTDNLFFEQVFEEFADLLDVFSRVFLVVNIDSSKQDLGPDGSLEPSLEQRDPKRIIEAFENLTVSAQIRSAIDSGRLRIYLIDLLQTATESLQAENPAPEEATTGDAATDRNAAPPASDDEAEPADDEAEPADEEEAPAGDVGQEEEAVGPEEEEEEARSETAPEPGPHLGFDNFLADLTDYLNSSEYIVEFMRDSLRQADSILHEVRDSAKSTEIAEFRAGIEALQARTDAADRQLQALDQLRSHEWSGPLEELAAEIRQQVTEHSGAVLPELEKTLHREVETWAGNDESMRDLVEHRVQAEIKAACQRSRTRAIEIFDRVCRDRNGGVRTGEEVSRQLMELGLSFDDIYPAFQPNVRKQLEAGPELPDASGLQDALPLRRRFVDWILFRNDARVRQRFFGADNPSERAFTAKAKAKRLSEENIREFCSTVGDYARQCNLICVQEVLENLLREYQEAFLADARQRVDACHRERKAEYDTIKDELECRKRVLLALDEMEASSDQLEARVGELQNRFIPHKAVFELEKSEDDLEAGPLTADTSDDSNQD
ncbi:MAG: hypothetical protein R6U56_10835 [Opitutales bacterium]